MDDLPCANFFFELLIKIFLDDLIRSTLNVNVEDCTVFVAFNNQLIENLRKSMCIQQNKEKKYIKNMNKNIFFQGKTKMRLKS